MHWLIDLLLEVVTWIGFHPTRSDRSVVGESELDRSARRLWWIVSAVVLGAIGIAFLLAAAR